jgi:hypothetical protein
MSYILRALDKEGNILFYTGKTGMDWLTYNRGDAFAYFNRDLALQKSTNFNRMEPVHGYWFTVQTMVPVS